MRRITLWLLSTLSALVLLFSYHTSTRSASATAAHATANPGGTASAANGDSSTPTTTPSPATTPDAAASATPDAAQPSASSGTTAAAGQTIAGDVISTRYGNVQVQITVADGRVTQSIVLQVPWNDHRDQQINSYAVPILNQEAVAAQSAQIDMVSGATYTSEAYLQSLQSALDQANL